MSNARNLSQGDTRFVNTSGDTMTGDLSVTGGNFTVGSTNANPFNWSGSTNPVSISADASNTWAQLSLQGNGTGGTGINLGSSGLRHAGIFSLDGSSLAFATNNTNSGISTREHMRIDSAGRVTMPYQPAFSVTNSTNTFSSGTIVFNTAQVNVGGHYSTSNGRFTAPVAGNYYFIFATIVGNSGGFQVILQKNGSGVSGVGYCDTGSNDTGVVAKVISLSAGDYVTAYTSTGNIESAYSSFAGYLIG